MGSLALLDMVREQSAPQRLRNQSINHGVRAVRYDEGAVRCTLLIAEGSIRLRSNQMRIIVKGYLSPALVLPTGITKIIDSSVATPPIEGRRALASFSVNKTTSSRKYLWRTTNQPNQSID